ncbi:Uncharacterised protein [Actinobaculum suis]|uniref:Glycosyltransferase RgtA/B/C/D-like domain-containing protein n=1 Tax=Actinobaculum suis TaxID=1657 RepID=A0A0K9EW04_9ACTO|nr:glycosyltransferase family 39 protein [Actinobaculum suis]KMY24157.1 hypothetical protein ACU19_00260 [Actinobaculum suis]OCA95264.1 hypothetical protein ACU21_04795 [Actinobaculum suis]VDG75974.1 Uncharacterised protein [Actinobaculum suis]
MARRNNQRGNNLRTDIRSGLGDGLCAALLFLLVAVWAGVALAQHPSVHSSGEWTYIDYAEKISRGHIPVQGEKLGEVAQESWACNFSGVTEGVVVPPDCENWRTTPIEEWPYRGENYNAFHPPLYFWVVGTLSRAIEPLTGSFLLGARLGSALLTGLGIAALFAAIRMWNVSRPAAFAGSLLVLTAPVIAGPAVLVHNDAVGVLAGAAAVWMGARIFQKGNYSPWLPALATAAICCARVMAVSGIVVLMAWLALCLLWPAVGGLEKNSRLPVLRYLVVQAVVIIVTYVGWSAFQNRRVPEGYVPAISGVSTAPLDGISLGTWLHTLTQPYGLSNPQGAWHMSLELYGPSTKIWGTCIFVLFLAAPFLALLLRIRDVRDRNLAVQAATGPLVVALLVQVREAINNGAYFTFVFRRYGIANVPVIGASLAAACDRPRWRAALQIVAWVGFAAMLAGALS